MSPLDELAGPSTRRETYLRAWPLLRLAAADDVDVDTAFGEKTGSAIVLSAAEHLSHPLLSGVHFMTHWRELKEAVAKFEGFHDGTLDEDGWTADEVAGEVLAPLAWLLNGVEGCRACFHTAHNAAMIRGRLNGEVACTLHVVKYCAPCLQIGNPPKLAVIVTGGHGVCGACADRAPISIWPAHLTAVR
jgi:hypothetical protein